MGSDRHTVEVEALKRIINRLLDHIIEVRGIKHVELKQDYYWDMPAEELYNVNEKPQKLDVGSLRDDWEFVSTLLDDKQQPVSLQLTEVAPLLRYLGEIIGR